MRGASVLELPITDKDSRSEEEEAPRKRALKSGKVRRVDTTILCNITWPHEVIYTCTGQPAESHQLNITRVVSGFLTAMAAEKGSVKPYMLQHLHDLMADAKLYGWEPVRAFHALWLQQLEQGCITWDDDGCDIEV